MCRAITGWLAKNSSASSQEQVEHLGDVLALELDVEGVAVVAGALAHLAGHVHVGQEVHLDLDRAVARSTPRSGRRLTLKEKRPGW